jgi:hypothetical protein
MNMQYFRYKLTLQSTSSRETKYIKAWVTGRRNVKSKNIIWIYLVAIYISSIDQKKKFFFLSVPSDDKN